MGRIKDIFIDKMNEQGPDDTDWNAPEYDSAGFTEADRDPEPITVGNDGKNCWEIKSTTKDDVSYKIWAFSYKEALELLPMIEDF